MPVLDLKGLEKVYKAILNQINSKQPKGDYALKDELPDTLSDLSQDSTHRTVTDTEKSIWNAKSNFSGNYNDLANKPTIPSIEGLATEAYVDNKIAVIPTPDVSGQINTHNTTTDSHSDIRELISGLTTRLSALADSDDTTLDQMSEIVAYIKSNKSLIENVTTNKVNVSDIINNLTTNVANKPLSAAQGAELKALIDAIVVPTKVSQLTNDSGYITGYTETDPTVPAWAKASTKPSYTAAEVGADVSGTANSVVSNHNTSTSAHSDIRSLISGLDSDKFGKDDIDTTLSVAGKIADSAATGLTIGHVTPQMYGAKADGATDDTQAIQSAVNSGKEVFFPQGTYKITGPIVIPYNCAIKGTNSSIIVGNSNIDGFTISTDEVFIENITITNCKYAINLNGNKNIFSRVYLKNSTVGCYINSARSWGNAFNNCRFEYNGIGIESTIIYTSSFTDCKIAFNTNFGIKANLNFIKFEGGYIEGNGSSYDSTLGKYIPREGTAGIYIPNDANRGSNSVYFICVDFENNGEASIRQDNEGRAFDFVFIGCQLVVSGYYTDTDENGNPIYIEKAAIWINAYGHCVRWTFYGTKFPESENTQVLQVAGKADADWTYADLTKKPTTFTTNRYWKSGNKDIILKSTIDGNYVGVNTEYVTNAEKNTWNSKATMEQVNTAINTALEAIGVAEEGAY